VGAGHVTGDILEYPPPGEKSMNTGEKGGSSYLEKKTVWRCLTAFGEERILYKPHMDVEKTGGSSEDKGREEPMENS